MACYKPLRAWRNERGLMQFQITRDALGYTPLPCGQCIGCRLEYARQWAVRCMHETYFHEKSCFITLTYNPEHLPSDRSLNKQHFQKFMKRLRRRTGLNIRFYACGEYGEKLSRPHYHAIIWGYDFPDREFFFNSNGVTVYRSAELADIWGKGYVSLGDVTFESAGYVARYCTKKITGDRSAEHYCTVDEYGQLHEGLQPEFSLMSLKPGIGRQFLDTFQNDIYPHDELVIMRKGKPVVMKPPRYYDSVYEKLEPLYFEHLKLERKAQLKGKELENSGNRLSQKHRVKQLQTKQLLRTYENEA